MSDSLNLGGPLAPPAVATVKPPAVGTLELTPPAPVPVIPDDQVDSMVPIDEATRAQLRTRAAAFADDLAAQDPRSPAFQEKINDITRMGEREIVASARVSNRMLERPAAAMRSSRGRGGPAGDAQTRVAGTLVELRRTVTDLDPGRADLKGARKLLGVVPFGNKIASYFQRYQSAQKQLDAIITALGSGQDELRKDNAAIEQEKANLWAAMGKLTEYATLAKALDGAVTAKVEQLRYTSPAAADALTSDALFPIRQREQDLLTQLAVSVQGYLALDLVRKNNLELIKGVDRAQTTTVAALRTAVVVAQALANQKLVLDQINALNATTNNMIVQTSELLRQQSGQIQAQASASTVSVEALQTAFDNIFATMDEIDSYRVKAVDSMASTVAALETQVGRSKAYLERARANER
ncbi:toxic anion resistance protein [Frankia sp. CNm7]|uniref:Toxic anion resistance protein n=1 Tax=Frankia nepalensis TaxID=1836974 RepID=A0A937UPW7_9ACTN|nr:toxic anion resistance protein [Frankia nepalensis]MBL7495454.1 toxic anion resistance protein [Frankia nepalensis]MBL7510715.1 toxic anion resistance protein [Frankia nepalensis]MBL7521678.1 toxic anion resistance protein [Frankia nepalensis]MBL7626011.1 toxic anion resistance protein [Frankia nepalensis]